MLSHPGLAIAALWGAWVISWLLAAFWRERTVARPALGVELRYRVPLLLGTVLFALPAHGYSGRLRLWYVDWAQAWICAALVAAGIVIAWWARLYLGPLWSGRITRKAEHRVVDTGPYALVRHPIYTGLLLALGATEVAKGTLLGLFAFGCLVAGLWLKARSEEQWLTQELGSAYDQYRRRVPMLVPWWPPRR